MRVQTEDMFEWQYQIILRSVKRFIDLGLGSEFVSTATAKTNYLTALENKHLRQLFRVEELPLYTKKENTAKKCKWDWKDPKNPKHTLQALRTFGGSKFPGAVEIFFFGRGRERKIKS